MTVNWTPEQKNAIEARGGSLLISAAAGSGKTAVLSERVMHRVFDKEAPVDVDRLLIVTFTEAAVAQMRDKIGSKLTALLEEHPQNMALRRQQILMTRAHISTIHAFCMDLVRQNFQKLLLPPDFSVGDETELGNLREQALTECMEQFYQNDKDNAFTQLAEAINSGRDDRKLSETVYRLYDFIRSHPFYEDWLDSKLAMYDASLPVCNTVWGHVILAYARESVSYCEGLLQEAILLIDADDKLAQAYGAPFREDLINMQGLKKKISVSMKTQEDWDALRQGFFEARTPARLGRVMGEKENPAKIRVGEIRDEMKKMMKRLAENLFCSSAAEFTDDICDLHPKIEQLFSLTKAFSARLDEKKRERSLVDFSDLEQYALALLYDRTQRNAAGGPIKTPLACELAGRFDEIMIDEYQDTNEAQNMIFNAVAKEDEAGTAKNLFLVGDVKQSIYRFRQAMPEIFIEKKKSYAFYDGVHFPAKITLGANFRSRAGVTQAVNFVFRQLMSETLGELDYGTEEALLPYASYPQNNDICTELAILEPEENGEWPEEKLVLEARMVAQRIQQMLTQGYPVTENGVLRPARQSDFCILMRSGKGKLGIFVRELQKQGINAWAELAGNFLSTREISVMLSLLRVLDNPLLDIPLTAVMLSELFAFTPDELAAVRLLNRNGALYLNVCAAARQSDAKCDHLMKTLQKFSAASVTETVDHLLLRIYRETDYLSLVSAMPLGENRKANLYLLAEYAAGYNRSGNKSLCGFVRFVDRVLQRGSDFSPASTLSESADVVRVMTIHHSKGLEFPVVFLCDTAKLHNNADYTRERTILHPTLGFACRRRDAELLKEFTTVPMEALKLESERSSLSEELRILYVAMTRAKEKLILTMTQEKLESKLKALAAGLGQEERVSSFVVRRCRSYADWLLLCALRHPDGVNLRGRAALDDHMVLESDMRLKITFCTPLAAQEEAHTQEICLTSAPQKEAFHEIKVRAAYHYPYEAATLLPAKLGVSAVVRRGEGSAFRFQHVPRFLTHQELSGAQKGLALHAFMQFSNYKAAAQNAGEELQRMRTLGFLTHAQADSIEVRRLEHFFAAPIYARMAAAEKMWRELRLLSRIPAAEIGFLQAMPEDEITVQGVADCVFLENGACIVVDYKTDRVKSKEELAERYRPQLALYKKMIEENLHVPVRQCVLYSFALECEIPLQ